MLPEIAVGRTGHAIEEVPWVVYFRMEFADCVSDCERRYSNSICETAYVSATRKAIRVRGLPYMTSAVGGGRGVPEKQTKGTKSADLCT